MARRGFADANADEFRFPALPPLVRGRSKMNSSANAFDALTVTLNPAIDCFVTLPRFAIGAVNRAENATEIPGGKGVNVASALADYGLRVAATGFLGRENSSPFDGLFARKQITDGFVRLAGRTRVAIKVFDPVGNETTDINFPGLTPTAADLDTLRTRIAALAARWVIVAGSLPPGVSGDFYRQVVTRLRAGGVRVALDTSGEALSAGIAAAPTLVKPNLNELVALVGRPLRTGNEIVTAARGLVLRGVELVVISMGPAGAYFVTADEAVLARSPSVQTASAVGAGDAMVAGLVAARLRGVPLRECARLATAFSAHLLNRRASGETDAAAAIDALASTVDIIPFGDSAAPQTR